MPAGLGTCCFLMLNPSTATEQVLDPTVRRCIGYAQGWGYDRLEVLNLFAMRSTKPLQLYLEDDPVGPGNDEAILKVASKSSLIVCAWGLHGKLNGRGEQVKATLIEEGLELNYLKLTKDGQPGHPLYLKKDLKPITWD